MRVVDGITRTPNTGDRLTSGLAHNGGHMFGHKKTQIPAMTEALPGRPTPAFQVPAVHAVLGTSLTPPFPDGMEVAIFGLGCFWGAERLFWRLDGVHSTATGYAGGFTPNPTYEEVCSG